MNIRKHVSAAFIAIITALNTVSFSTGNAQIKTDMNITQTTVKEESDGYYIAIGVKDTETDVPAQVDDFTVSKLCLDRVYLADDYDEMAEQTTEDLKNDGVDITEYYTYTGEDSLTYLGVNVGNENLYLSVNIPEEYDGKKIDRIKLRDVVCPASIDAERLDAIELYLPEGVELDPDVRWTAEETGFHTIVVYDSDLERKEYHVWPSEMSDLYIYSVDYDFDDLNADVDLSEIKFRFADQEDMSEPTDVYSENLKLRVPSYAKIVNDKWLAADTNILQITVYYPDGRKEIYKAEDYDYYQKESGNFKEYNRILSNWNYSGHMEVFGEEAFNDEALWIFTDYEDIDRIPEYTDESRLVVNYLGPWSQNIDVDELKFPDNLKEIYLEDSAFENVNINKLILPGCKLFYDDNTFAESNIKEAIFDGDVSLKHNTFRDNPNLENVTFKGNADLDFSAFWNCKALKNINIDMNASFDGMAFDDCHELMTINGESPLDESGDLKPEFEGFVSGNFNASAGIGFIDKYLDHSIKKAVSEVVTDDMSDIEKVRALHDKLCSMTKYDTGNEEAKKNHVDGSAFLNDSTVCDGYARAMNLLLHEAGIESCYVGTTDHAWVIVKLGDHYFHVDPTWDDGTDVVYDWFLDSDDEIKDDPSHAGWKLMCPSELHSFQWEKMPKCTDKMGDVNEDDIIDGRDASAILNGYAKSSAGGDSDIDSIIGDYDFNGVVDGRDASAVLTAYTKASSVQ